MRTLRGMPRRAFTLVELLVVIAIIGTLIGLLVPALGVVQATSRATGSQSNLRQWGMGTLMYADHHKQRLPWEGKKDAADMETNLAERSYWANAVPPFVGQKSYIEVIDEAINGGVEIPMAPGSKSIFVDPAASTEMDAPYEFGPVIANGRQRAFSFNYVPNSELNNTYLAEAGITQNTPNYTMSLNIMRELNQTILMLEMRGTKDELPGTDIHHGLDLDRHRCDWKRFANRHFDGGHLLYGDNHVAHETNRRLITNRQGSTDPATPGGDWNKGGFVWDPLGPATDQP